MSRTGARVSSDRIARTPVGPPGGAVTGLIGDEAILAQLKLGDDDPLWAARLAARYVMLRGHGCTGEGCRKRGHGADLAALRGVLECLGLRPGA